MKLSDLKQLIREELQSIRVNEVGELDEPTGLPDVDRVLSDVVPGDKTINEPKEWDAIIRRFVRGLTPFKTLGQKIQYLQNLAKALRGVEDQEAELEDL